MHDSRSQTGDKSGPEPTSSAPPVSRGLIGCVVAVIVLGGLCALGLPWSARARERARRISCASNLYNLVCCMHAYAMDYDGFFPDELSRLYPTYVSALGIFSCPSNSKDILSPDRIEQDGSYVYVQGATESDPDGTLVMHDKLGNHGSAGRNEAYVNCQGEWRPNE